MARRPVAVLTAVVLLVEALAVAFLNWFLGLVVDKQEMSLAGLEPHAMTVSAWVAGGLCALYLVACAAILLRGAIRDRSPAGVPRVLLISAAVVHGLLGAFAVGLVGWVAFLAMMVVLALLVLALVGYDRADPTPPEDGAPGDGGAGPVPLPNSPKPTGS